MWVRTIPCQWYQHLNSFLVSNHFHINEGDSNVYIKFKEKRLIIIVVYVDDSIFLGKNVNLMEDTKKIFSKEFEMSNLGSQATFIWGWRSFK